MRLADLVDASADVASTRSRTAKRDRLVQALTAAGREELPLAVSYLSGVLPQGKIGMGYRTVAAVEADPGSDSPALEEVDAVFTAIASDSGTGSQARKQDRLGSLLARCTGPEQDFLRRLIVGELRQGANEGLMVEAIAATSGIDHDLVRRAVMFSGDPAEVASTAVTAGASGLASYRLRLFRPLRPMLAQTADDVGEALARTGAASVEQKLDGLRIQVHRDGNRVRVYSRSLRDITAETPGVVEATRGLPADRFVLDGEALGYGPDGEPLAFQDSMAATTAPGLVPRFFDCLHRDGADLIDRPIADRWAALAGLVPADLLVDRLETDDPVEAGRFYEHLVTAGSEGVVVKALDSVYDAGRRGANWIKVKPAHTLDLVVLAVEWGSGRRNGLLSNIHLGARDPDGGFVVLGKTFKGMTDEMLAWQTERFLGLETHREGRVVHLRPEQVVEVAVDGVQASPRYPGGVALRFARVKRYRDDKGPDEVDTIETVRALHARS